jgi:uncharacterized membrane protein YkoI
LLHFAANFCNYFRRQEVAFYAGEQTALDHCPLDPHITGTGRFAAKVQNTHNELLEKLVSRITPDSLRRAPTTLTHAIALAQEHSGGRARSTDVDRKDDRIEYNIETVKLDGTLHKMRVSATKGKVIADEEG